MKATAPSTARAAARPVTPGPRRVSPIIRVISASALGAIAVPSSTRSPELWVMVEITGPKSGVSTPNSFCMGSEVNPNL